MHFHDYFRKQTIRDRHFRMSRPTALAVGYPLFTQYAAGNEFRPVCKHIYEIKNQNPLMEDRLLDFETEGRWFCLQNWVVMGFSGLITSQIAFERQEDYAMFRLFGFGE